MPIRKALAISVFILYNLTAYAQNEYPTDYFRNPLDIPMMLAGNFGECRPNHFHSGIDIKTNERENYKVYAAAEGYISRIKMEPGGFGHALYVAHPNGYTTLYAHLNDFIPAVQQYVTEQQYKNESWELDMTLEADKFPVKKGQHIAWSGNTGGSAGPHLHFEIRNSTTEHPLNPLLFGLPIVDKIAPKPTQLAIYPLTTGIYSLPPQMVTLKKKGEGYTADTFRINAPNVGIGVDVFDYMNGSNNTLNFYTAELYMDDQLQCRIRLDDIGYDVTRYLHAYIDYKYRKTKGDWIQCLFQVPGNKLDHIYEELNTQKGMLTIGDGKPHAIRIVLTDALDNVTNINFYLFGAESGQSTICPGYTYKPNKAVAYDHPNVVLKLDELALYDDICFEVKNSTDASSLSDKYSIGEVFIPMHTWNELKIKPNKAIGFDKRDKVVLIYSDGKSESGKAATYEDGWYKARIRNFGTYFLVEDSQPPVVKALQANNANLAKAKSIRFTAIDKITSVKKFRAELDGKWLKFEQRGNAWFYNFDAHCPKGKHKLVVTATDENNNKTVLQYNFTR